MTVHLGHARSRGGRIVLRLEDLDVERVEAGMLAETRRDLEWLGLDWDSETWIQSEHALAFDGAVQELLARGLPHPRWWHVPLVTDETGRRLAKRSDDISLARIRSAGIDTRALVSGVARRSGIEAADPASARDLLARFSMQRVPRAPVPCGPMDLAELGL